MEIISIERQLPSKFNFEHVIDEFVEKKKLEKKNFENVLVKSTIFLILNKVMINCFLF